MNSAQSRTITFLQVVIQYLNSSAQPRSAAQLAAEFRVTSQQAKDVLKELARTRRAKRVGVGLYAGMQSSLPEQIRQPSTIDWDRQPLGMATDRELAGRLGVSATAVCRARVKRRIPSYTGVERYSGAAE